ncbi:MAG: GNAT family N-acetyltransferase [Clostridiales bacterium]|nr:GNAT family N-acetyltransferase [Clostridiales bacterium]
MFQIGQITEGKKRYLDLLLLGDEQESMIDRYLERGDLFVLEVDSDPAGVCVVTREEEGLYEIRNLAVSPSFQRRGYGRELVLFLFRRYPDCRTIQLGTGDSPATLDFYSALGFSPFRWERDFFLRYYDHPIYEGGRQLKDMVYLRRDAPVGDAL